MYASLSGANSTVFSTMELGILGTLCNWYGATGMVPAQPERNPRSWGAPGKELLQPEGHFKKGIFEICGLLRQGEMPRCKSGTKIALQNRSDHGGRKRPHNHFAAEIARFFALPAASKSLAASDFWVSLKIAGRPQVAAAARFRGRSDHGTLSASSIWDLRAFAVFSSKRTFNTRVGSWGSEIDCDCSAELCL